MSTWRSPRETRDMRLVTSARPAGPAHSAARVHEGLAAASLVGRRALLATLVSAAALSASPTAAFAAVDCFKDCNSNCNRVAPRSIKYCESSCNDYCLQEDRRDGLSGSVSSEAAEVWWSSAYDLGAKITGNSDTVVYGADRPPALKIPKGIEQSLMDAVGGRK